MIRAAGRASGCFKGLRGQLGTRSRVYLSVVGEFVNGAGPEVGVPILSSWCCLLGDSTVAGFLVLLKIIFGMSLTFLSFHSNVMSIDRRAVFEQNTSMWKELLRTVCSQHGTNVMSIG